MSANKPGKIILDLAPSPGNPRNSEGAFLTLDNGEILFIYSAFKGESNADHAYTDLKALRSYDGGETFEDAGTVLTCEGEDGVNIMSVSLLRMENGDVGLFYLVRTTYTLMRMFLRRSADGGRTWSERVCCMRDGYYVVNNDRVTRLSDGRILLPSASHRAYMKEDGQPGYDSFSEVVWYCSDDDGYTWYELPKKCIMPASSHCRSGLQEPGVLELAPGVLWAWARTDMSRQYEMFSTDGGLSWTPAQPSWFTSPNSPLCMKRLSDGSICAVWNPVPIANGQTMYPGGTWTGGRTPLVIAFSTDNGKNFSDPVILEDEWDHGYCYTAIHEVEGGILLGYCAGGPEDVMCLCRLRIRKIRFEELR
ncbi:MAG: exo-alpha-sialidase [Oscillospiraceae bacterium]|nr:exo-alpha-sialidase [Oscillospiraceae bacterium]